MLIAVTHFHDVSNCTPGPSSCPTVYVDSHHVDTGPVALLLSFRVRLKNILGKNLENISRPGCRLPTAGRPRWVRALARPLLPIARPLGHQRPGVGRRCANGDTNVLAPDTRNLILSLVTHVACWQFRKCDHGEDTVDIYENVFWLYYWRQYTHRGTEMFEKDGTHDWNTFHVWAAWWLFQHKLFITDTSGCQFSKTIKDNCSAPSSVLPSPAQPGMGQPNLQQVTPTNILNHQNWMKILSVDVIGNIIHVTKYSWGLLERM